jgi:hypothetical protein
MRARVLAAVVVVALATSAAVVALASGTADGLPAYTNGYAKWPRINKKPFTGGSSAHAGIKNVYASKKKVGKRYPNGTVIVKSIRRPSDPPSLPGQVAVMRKTNGSWRYVEYQLGGSRYGVLAQGQLCQSCHAQARATDYVFTK